MKVNVQAIERDFVVLSPEKRATMEKCDASLYQRLEERYSGFKRHELISGYEFCEDWASWEMHPNGDEIIVLLSGKATFVLQFASGPESVSLVETGSYVIIPKGVWHTAKVNHQAKVLFITPGAGTQHKHLESLE